jgi:hypothetical protein
VIVRFDRMTGQSGPVFTPAPDDRFGPRPGMDLSKKDPHWMFVGSQFVSASNDRVTWKRISPDLTARTDRQGTGTITAIAASPLDVNLLWVGTQNGLVHVTRDMGKTWTNVSPPRLSSQSTLVVWSMEASSHDAGVAYVGAIDLSDTHGPSLFMTKDFGATWTEINNGLPADVPTRAVREDPVRSSLLYAATQRGVFVSFDRGGMWQPLQQNLPPVPVNDLTVHGDDLIAATWGRGLWALDNVTPLRQIADAQANTAPIFLYQPANAVRVRWDNNQDTPLPPEVPQGQNPPDGVAIDYEVKRDRSLSEELVTISIHDAAGTLVREYNSTTPPDTRMPNVPEYWFKKPVWPSGKAGMHRLVWDLRYTTPPSIDIDGRGMNSDTVSFGIIAPAIVGETSKQQPIGALVLPGQYEVRLTASGQTVRRMITVINDPRSEATAADLAAQFRLERALSEGIAATRAAINAVIVARSQAQMATNGHAELNTPAAAFDQAVTTTLAALATNRSLAGALPDLQFADMKPTESTIAAVEAVCARADAAFERYRTFVEKDLVAMNAALRAVNVALPSPSSVPASACGPLREIAAPLSRAACSPRPPPRWS